MFFQRLRPPLLNPWFRLASSPPVRSAKWLIPWVKPTSPLWNLSLCLSISATRCEKMSYLYASSWVSYLFPNLFFQEWNFNEQKRKSILFQTHFVISPLLLRGQSVDNRGQGEHKKYATHFHREATFKLQSTRNVEQRLVWIHPTLLHILKKYIRCFYF